MRGSRPLPVHLARGVFAAACSPSMGRGLSATARAQLFQGARDRASLALDRTRVPGPARQILNHGPPGKFLPAFNIFQVSFKGTEVATF